MLTVWRPVLPAICCVVLPPPMCPPVPMLNLQCRTTNRAREGRPQAAYALIMVSSAWIFALCDKTPGAVPVTKHAAVFR